MMEYHPYGEFIPKKARALLIGSFPIGKFTDPKRRSEIGPHEFDFFFGGERNLLWKLLAEVFGKTIKTKEDIQAMLNENGLGMADVIRACRRKDGGASDKDLYDIQWNENLLKIIQERGITKLYFTSKKVEIWFKRLFPKVEGIQMITLISPSGQSVRSLWKRPDYQLWAKKHPQGHKRDFILESYREAFSNLNCF